MSHWRYRLEAMPIFLMFGLFRTLPLDVASAFGGWLGRSVGPHLPVSRDASRQLAAILPAIALPERQRIIYRMWEGLGRMAGELPHLNRPAFEHRIACVNPDTLAGQTGPFLFVSGHLSNWELLPRALASLGMPIHLLYRPANNPYVDALMRRVRGVFALGLLAKGARGARGLHRAVRKGQSLGLLVDQKENNGIALPFLGREAMTGTLAARLALDHGLTIVPIRAAREKGACFAVEFGQPLPPEAGPDRDRDIMRLMRAIHAQLEAWIVHDPAQWFWMHHRWPRAIYLDVEPNARS